MSSRPRARTAAARPGDRGRRTPCSDCCVSLTCGVAMRAKTVRATRSSSHRRASPSRRRNCIDRAQRVAAGASRTYMEAEPSWSTTMSRPTRPRPGATPRGRASATIEGGARDHHAQPERQVAQETPALAHRRDAGLAQAPQIGPASHDAPHPQHQQRGWQRQQPEVGRRREDHRADVGKHASLASALAPHPAARGLLGIRLAVTEVPRGQDLELFRLDLGGGPPGSPCTVGPRGRSAVWIGPAPRGDSRSFGGGAGFIWPTRSRSRRCTRSCTRRRRGAARP